jgi:hypothetical protein
MAMVCFLVFMMLKASAEDKPHSQRFSSKLGSLCTGYPGPGRGTLPLPCRW